MDILFLRSDMRWLSEIRKSGKGVVTMPGVLAKGILRLLPGLVGLSQRDPTLQQPSNHSKPHV